MRLIRSDSNLIRVLALEDSCTLSDVSRLEERRARRGSKTQKKTFDPEVKSEDSNSGGGRCLAAGASCSTFKTRKKCCECVRAGKRGIEISVIDLR